MIFKEIEILNPDYLVFFSGANYDSLLKYAVGDFELKSVKGFTQRQMSEVVFTNLSTKAIRTYHPNYLYRNSIDRYLNSIVTTISNNLNF